MHKNKVVVDGALGDCTRLNDSDKTIYHKLDGSEIVHIYCIGILSPKC